MTELQHIPTAPVVSARMLQLVGALIGAVAGQGDPSVSYESAHIDITFATADLLREIAALGADNIRLLSEVRGLRELASQARDVASAAAYSDDGVDMDDAEDLIQGVHKALGDGDDWDASQKCSDDPCERCGEGGIRHVRKIAYARYEGLCDACHALDASAALSPPSSSPGGPQTWERDAVKSVADAALAWEDGALSSRELYSVIRAYRATRPTPDQPRAEGQG